MADTPTGTLVDLLRERAAAEPDRLAFRFVDEGDERREPGLEGAPTLTLGGLWAGASAVADRLAATAGATPGERVVLALAPGLDFVTAFFGVLAAGMVAVPLPPGRGSARGVRGLTHHPVVADADPAVVVTRDGIAAWERRSRGGGAMGRGDAPGGADAAGGAGGLALLQYTSGSTGTPKGVMLTHANLLANMAAIAEAMGMGPADHGLIWLPPYHDMGLIGGILTPLLAGFPVTLTPPATFAGDPLRWLELVSETGATISGGPTTAYELCTRAIERAPRRLLDRGVDLSRWAVAFVGAEPVRAAALHAFAAAVAPTGFPGRALYPCYGLAEACLMVTGGRRGAGLDVRPPSETGGGPRVACGPPVAGTEVRIAPDGEVLVRGPAVAAGYFGQPEATATTFGHGEGDGWLHTGDLGEQTADGSLLITGRAKDLLIVRGRNVDPADVEAAATASHPALIAGGAAAVAGGDRDRDRDDGPESIVVLAEVARHHADHDLAEVAHAIRGAVATAVGIAPTEVVLVRAATLPRTTSGKVRRRSCRALHHAGGLDPLLVLRTEGADAEADADMRSDGVPTHDPGLPGADALRALDPHERRAVLRRALGRWLALTLDPDGDRGTAARRGPASLTAAGLDSLGLARLQHHVAQRTGVHLGLEALLDADDLDAIAADLSDRIEAPPEHHGIGAAPGAPEAPPPVTLLPGQVAMWWAEQRDPGHLGDVLARAIRLERPLDVDALRIAVAHVVTRHPGLRLRTDVDERGQPEGHVLEAVPSALHLVDATGEGDDDRLLALVRQWADRPFDLASPPLVRVVAFVGAPGGDVLLLSAHHLAVDLWSTGILLTELADAYAAATNDLAPPLPAAADPGPGAAATHLARALASPRGAAARRWWHDAAARASALALPTDRPRATGTTPTATGPAAGAVARAVAVAGGVAHDGSDGSDGSADGSDAVADVARRLGVSPFAVHLAVLVGLLHRITAQATVTVGTPFANRGDPALAGVVGFLANPLPVVVDVAPEDTLTTLARRAHRGVLAAADHQQVPLAQIVAILGGARDAGRSPLFDVLLTAPHGGAGVGATFAGAAPGAAVSIGPLSGHVLDVVPHGRQVDLAFEATGAGRAMHLAVRHDTHLYDHATAQALADGWATLLRHALARPDLALAELPTTDLPIADLPATVADAPSPPGGQAATTPVPLPIDAVREQVRATPHALALRSSAGQVTYAELWRRAGVVADRITEQAGRIAPDTVIGVTARRSIDTVATMVGVWRAGGAYLPLDPALPPERLTAIVADARPAMVLDPAALALDRSAHDRSGRPSPASPAPPPGPPRHADHLAYVLFTSGSTGRPKGVAITHGNVAALLRWAADTFGADERDHVLAATTFGFDLSVFEVFLPLTTGGTVVLADDLFALPHVAARDHVTLVNTVPSLLSELLRHHSIPAGVRAVNLAGEALPAALAASVHHEAPQARVRNLYGPTEDTTYSTWAELGPGDDRIPTIGAPLPDTEVVLVRGRGADADADAPGVRAGPLEPGELWLTGAGLARGYLGRPGLTADRFAPDPLPDPTADRLTPGRRWYRTGDLARTRGDGALLHLGRVDQQVKLNGVRIELGEIEAVLAAHPDVAAAAVALVADPRPRLVGYLVPQRGAGPQKETDPPGGPLDEGVLRAHAARRLPPTMVPTAWVTLAALPTSANGKLRRDALPPPPPPSRTEGAGAGRPPHGALEVLVAEAWADAIGDEPGAVTSATTDFFAAGGHSLAATSLLARLRAVTGHTVPLARFFDDPTIAGLARALEAIDALDGASDGGDLGREGIDPPPAAMPANQARFWFLHQLDPTSPRWNLSARLVLRGPLDPERLRHAFATVVDRHDALRTTLAAVDGEPVAHVAPPGAAFTDRCWRTADAPSAAEADGLAGAEARAPFDLAVGPLVRALLVRVEPPGEAQPPAPASHTEHHLVVTLHHAVGDAWSLDLLAAELALAYGGQRLAPAGDPRAAAGAEAARRRAAGHEAEVAWWVQRLAAVPPSLALPTDLPLPARRSRPGAAVPVDLGADTVARLAGLRAAEGATPFHLHLALWGEVLARFCRQPAFAVAAPVSTRDPGTDANTAGCFVATLPLPVDTAGRPSLRALVARTRATTLAALAHRDAPFDDIVRATHPDGRPGDLPLAQTMLVVHDRPAGSLTLADLDVTVEELTTGVARFELTLTIDDVAGGTGRIDYAADRFSAATAEALAHAYEALAAAAAADPDAPLATLSVVGVRTPPRTRPDPRRGPGAPAAAAPRPSFASLAQWVWHQAAAAPHRVAIAAPDDTWTYGHLVAEAGAVAAHLRAMGIGPEDRVGVMLPRRAATIAALLGVLRAGAAYVPLDPGDAPPRRAMVLADAGCRAVITTGVLAPLVTAADPTLAVLDIDAARAPDNGPAPSPRTSPGTTPPHPPAHPEQAAYVLFTSGTTGRPKGVTITHRSALALLRWAHEAFGPTTLDRTLAATALTFDLSVFEVFAPLTCGATVVLADDVLAIGAHPERAHVTLVNTVPSAMAAVLDTGGLPSAVAAVCLAGEPLSPALAHRVHAAGAPRLVNAYGPTEDTTYSTWTDVPEGAETVAIGRPLPGTTAQVSGPGGDDLPTGFVGEVLLEGEGLARGYLAQSGLTADRFRPAVVPGAAGQRCYRTGDLGRRRPDGGLVLVGRADHQVKVRGHRVELGEIEAALRALPEVSEAVVGLWAASSAWTGDALVAVVRSPSGPTTPTPEVLRAGLAGRLPSYFVPQWIHVVDRLPTTVNGKVDRRAALALAETAVRDAGLPASGDGDDLAPPATPTEELVAEVWAELLELPRARIGRTAHFFSLGGHSLLAARVNARVGDALDVDVPMGTVFADDRLDAFATALDGLVAAADAEMAALLDEIEGLSDDEVAARLAELD